METVTAQLLKQHADLVNYMYCEGIVNNHFINALNFRTEDNPDFVIKLDNSFRQVQDEFLEGAAWELQKEKPNYVSIHGLLDCFREMSISIGAQGLISTCNSFRTCYKAKNLEGCLKCFKRLEDEYVLIKSRLKTLVQLEHQIRAAGVIIPVMERPINNMKRAFNPE